MARRFTDDKLVVASHNAGKAREIVELLSAFPVKVISAAELNLPEPDETGVTYEENAILKAVAATTACGLPALADDSGVEISGLGNQPGIYSARWAGPNKDFAMAMERIRRELGDNPDRGARFVCVLSLAWPDGSVDDFRGEISGDLVFPPRGSKGFGYDPIFIPSGGSLTFGEMDPASKHAISHRAIAFAKLLDHLGIKQNA